MRDFFSTQKNLPWLKTLAGHRYVFALIVIFAILIAQWAVDSYLGHQYLATFLLLGTMLSAWQGGFGPALVVGLLGLLGVNYLFPAPGKGELAGLVLYLMIVLGMGLVGSGISNARRKATLEFERLQATLSSIGDAVVVINRAGKIISFNAGAKELTGWTSDEAKSQPVGKILALFDLKTNARISVCTALDIEQFSAYPEKPCLLQCQDGTSRTIEYTVAPICVTTTSSDGFVFVFRDITERWNEEKLLRSSERKFRHMADAAPVHIWMCDDDQDFYWFNRSWLLFAGTSLDEADRESFYSRIHPDDLEGFTRVFDQAFSQRAIFTREFRLRRHDGQYRWILDHGVPNWDAQKFVGYIGSCVDISDQKLIEQALRESNMRFSQLADNIAQLAWMANEAGEITWYNQRWFETTETTPEQMNAIGWPCVLHPDQSGAALERMQAGFSSQEAWSDTFLLRCKEGSYRWFLSYAIPILNSEAKITQWFGTCTDITKEKENSDALLELAQRLSESDRLKNEFLATLAHELRNPLAPIKNAVQILEMMKLDKEVEELRSTMSRQVEQLIRLIDDLMDVSRISRGKIVLKRETVNLASIINSSVEASRTMIDENGQALNITLPTQEIFVNVDPARIAQVVSNLLNNASKYSASNTSITLTVRTESESAVIEVKDHGIGIASEQLTSIFELFSQVNDSLERGSSGLGIGLALVKNLVELHGGSITAKSEGLGLGSTFKVALPVVISTANLPGKQVEDFVAMRSLQILVVEDQKALRLMLSRLLEKMGHSVVAVESGEEALDKLHHFKPDVVFSDIAMPGISGYELATKLRQQFDTASLFLVAMTGFGQESDRIKALHSGFDLHLVKPVDVSRLKEIFCQLNSPVRQS